MATVSQHKQDYKALYTGFDVAYTGLGVIDPNIYHSQTYRARKVDKVLIGGLQSIKYSGFEHDPQPLILPVAYEPQYHTIICWNLNYVPVNVRREVVRLHLKGNENRIKNQLPMIVDYTTIQRALPQLEGAIRRYKVVGVKVVDQYPLIEWLEAIKGRGQWANWYNKNQKQSAFDTIRGVFKRFMGNPTRRGR